MSESEKYSLNAEDGKKILKGAGIAIAGAFLTYIAAIATNIDVGAYTPLIVAGCSTFVNIARKWLEDY